MKSTAHITIRIKVDAPVRILETASHHVVVEYEGQRLVMAEGDELLTHAIVERTWTG